MLAASPSKRAVALAAAVDADAAASGRRLGGMDYYAQDTGLKVIEVICYFYDCAPAKQHF